MSRRNVFPLIAENVGYIDVATVIKVQTVFDNKHCYHGYYDVAAQTRRANQLDVEFTLKRKHRIRHTDKDIFPVSKLLHKRYVKSISVADPVGSGRFGSPRSIKKYLFRLTSNT